MLHNIPTGFKGKDSGTMSQKTMQAMFLSYNTKAAAAYSRERC